MDNTTPISYLYQKRHQNTTEPLGGARQSAPSPASKAGVCPCPLFPMGPRSFRNTAQQQGLQHKEVRYSPLISRTCNHLKKTFPFPGYSNPVDLPLHSSFALGLCWAKGDLPPERKLASRQAGRAAQVRQRTGRAEDSTKPGQARLHRAAQSRSLTSIQNNISSSSV